MEIRINTDKNITGTQHLEEKYSTEINTKLSRFSEYVTTLEVFLADENNSKPGIDDKRCTIEARIKNKNPEAVTYTADTLQHAIAGATEKMKNLLDSRIGKLQSK